jgi:hypothetical protein
MRYKALHIIILTVIFFGIFIIGDTSYQEFLKKDICADFTIIPACYVALVYFILLLIFHLIKNRDIWFFIFSGFALALTAFASFGHIFGYIQCVVSEINIPTCYIGFVLFSILIFLKFLEVKVNNK